MCVRSDFCRTLFLTSYLYSATQESCNILLSDQSKLEFSIHL